MQEAALSAHPGVARLILGLFAVRFDPATLASLEERAEQAARLRLTIEEALQAVESLDADRVLRRLAALVGAITRTNYYQTDAAGAPKPYISFKVASRELADLPAPKPFREIFVWPPPMWRASTCASGRWRAAACAGPTGATTSAPRCWAWSRPSRSRTR